MGFTPEAQALLDSISAVPDSKAKPVGMPLRYFMQKAMRLLRLATRDADKLAHIKYDIKKLDEISQMIDIVRELDAQHNNVTFKTPEAKIEFQKLMEEGNSALFEMESALEAVSNEDPSIQSKLAALRRGEAYNDQIQDLVDVRVHCEDHAALLDGIGFDKAILEKVDPLAKRLSELLADAQLDGSQSPAIRLKRDKVAAVLDETLDNLVLKGAYAFRHDSEHAAEYNMTYKARKRKNPGEPDPSVN